ncbi:allophanate hydrolase subunit 2-domain-containing protein [Macrophomina phaseolina]|uniref:Allophanate hydrolase subunit 2-domain-containing protein n=1 Tax=Macrophomina phaseolina TaxID=35725 RepID=A0ABQ8FTF2_9PEZI|nr:allophanate hydrolase subunit 2-domain-containing protein [Macrophomina phaseolina]
MQSIKTLLIANRGEIAVRIIRTAHRLNIHTIAIYSSADAASLHVSLARDAVLLPGPPSTAYTDEAAILAIARAKHADAIIPGYGFLSENAAFARAVAAAAITWVGPAPPAIAAFGVKHAARELARAAGVPVVPGTRGLVDDAESAVRASEAIGFPVMLKATGGGGGMGLVTCAHADAVRDAFAAVQSRGLALFKDPGVFVERYVAAARHVEVQVFGNGMGQAVHFGERECSIQRRHQKVVEECPSPFVEAREGLRERLGEAAVLLAESIKYGSAGTVEYLVDDETGDFFFLEMNTRLQVEHGITELCYGVDLVEMMLKQADAERAGNGGLDGSYLKSLQPTGPEGAAIEVRVYAENPVRDFAPSPGLLQHVEWKETPGTRIDTWVFTGSHITPNYDPLIAKVMHHAPTRSAAISGLHTVLHASKIHGPPTNLSFLSAILLDGAFRAGRTLTSFLTSFTFAPPAIDVLSAGAYTLVQDLPGRPSVGKGIPHAGPMDPLAFQLANALVGNARSTEALEITLSGPELRFTGEAVIALCGPRMEARMSAAEGAEGEVEFPMWRRVHVRADQRVRIGRVVADAGGCRAYLAVYGGFPGVASYFGSKSTSPSVGIGGYQGRQLAPGDLLEVVEEVPREVVEREVEVPERLRPVYTRDWKIKAMVGPHDEGYLLPEDVDMIYGTVWKVSHNASRSGIRLVGPAPKWARKDGGEGGSHPSNLVEYGYPLGTLNWTGDDPCIFPMDCPNFGGFVSSTTIVRAEWWKMGQIKAGDQMQYERVSLEDALTARAKLEAFLSAVEAAIQGRLGWDLVEPLDTQSKAPSTLSGDWGKSVLWHRPEQGNQPAVTYRQGGDDHLIIEYGHENFDLNYRCRVTVLEAHIRGASTPSWLKDHLTTTMGCCTSLLLFYDGSALPRSKLISYLQSLEDQLGDLSATKLTCRRFKLPLSFESAAQRDAIARYMETQRPHAPYLPDNLAFVARNNGITPDELKRIYLTGTHVAVEVGFFCGNTVCLPADPRMRLNCPKANPSRVYTPEGTVSWGGSCMSLYPVDSPGGYQMTGRTVPCFDVLGWKKGFERERPWLYRDFDLLTYYEVSEQEMEELLQKFRAGLYEWEWEEVEFDMAEHNRLLRETKDEVRKIREKQAIAQAEMVKAEQESLARWREEKKSQQVDESTVESLLDDPTITAIEAPVDANVWKVEVADGDVLKRNHLVSILEAMKLEISVRLPEGLVTADGPPVKVEKVLVRPGDTIKAGGRIALVRRG